MLTMQGGDSLVGGLPIIHITYQQYIANPSAYHDPDVIVHISGFPTAGNLPADYVGYDSNLNMEDIGNIATKAIAKVESSDTALYLHEVGTGFINKDGNYCITDVQIAVGGSIVLGTNCHVVDGGISNNLSRIATAVPDMSNLTDIKSDITSSSGYTALDDGFIVYNIVGNANASGIGFGITYDAETIVFFRLATPEVGSTRRVYVTDFKPINKGQIAKISEEINIDNGYTYYYYAPIKA